MAKAKSSEPASPKCAWQGQLSFGLITFPVRACTGARDEKISFNQICPTHHCKINMPTICPGDGTPHKCEKGDLLKGYEHRKGEFVYFTKAEIEATAPETSKSMEVIQFVKADELEPIYLDSSYLLTPGEGAGDPFRLLRLAMEAGNWVALAKLTMHGGENLVALRPYHTSFLMHTLYRENEVRALEVTQPQGEVNPALLAVCAQLIQALAAPFEPGKFTADTRQAAIKELIAARVADPLSVSTAPAVVAKKPPVADMMAALQASLAALTMKGGNGAATAAA